MIKKITTSELRKILNDYTGEQLFNKTEKEMKNYIKSNFCCSEYTAKVLAKEFCRGN